jgi:predicted  nucleic acid-binding Zn-ribbon protein
MATTTDDRIQALLKEADRLKNVERDAQRDLAKLRKQLTHAARSGLLSDAERRRALALARKPRRASSPAA